MVLEAHFSGGPDRQPSYSRQIYSRGSISMTVKSEDMHPSHPGHSNAVCVRHGSGGTLLPGVSPVHKDKRLSILRMSPPRSYWAPPEKGTMSRFSSTPNLDYRNPEVASSAKFAWLQTYDCAARTYQSSSYKAPVRSQKLTGGNLVVSEGEHAMRPSTSCSALSSSGELPDVARPSTSSMRPTTSPVGDGSPLSRMQGSSSPLHTCRMHGGRPIPLDPKPVTI
eukprot:gnl/TRDRNA2_/TRDRNA2_43561_c0_seq1.p1 gnl/TRDRNA2_/TRDRNA2_43561_c0~~gnl/TRDRNA2_/TRDRNA2_43561_c0_seq1.p1  ORF type:complete len:223 (-),score=12.88 gnl/TRDRNA2_/TRDRNA2_43561_c0_seq1:169-837(-)